ncbi:MAG: hypothetical protein A3B68_08545 [Candidatus Melainabacteria bacterium RIFCSPHIGHO2_02_FULL_34_12]|nr:MAG: hypothetical protein A3B68_08545 [Candidatus Melainabacteria bacterium RIFCSPHIGHO2_02_FULL_34_12]
MLNEKKLQDAYIISGLRTALGRGKKDGAFSQTHPVELGSILLKELIRNVNVNPEYIEDVIVGCATPCGEQGFNIGRQIARKAFGDKTPGTQVNRLCGSSAEAFDIACAKVMSGNYKLILAGGVESMSRVPMGSDMMPFAGDLKNIWKILTLGPKVVNLTMLEGLEVISMGISGELIAKKWKLSRKELDEFSYNSHKKAAHATSSGYFEKEILPVKTPNGVVKRDEGIRANVSIEKMLALKPAFKFDGVITAGNSSQITDGAAGILVANEDALKEYGLKPRAKFIASHVIGSDPELQLTGPIDVVPKVLRKAGFTINDIDLFEVNEAFASVVLATQKELNIPNEKLNVNGGAIALGHPLGVSGARLLVTLLNELERRNLKRGLSVLCIGGGQSIATIIERV